MSNKYQKKFKSLMAILLAAIMIIGVAASLISVAFAAEIAMEKVWSSNGVEVVRTKEEEVKNPDIVVEGSVGYDGKYCMNTLTPVGITISNNGPKIEGAVSIRVYRTEPYENYSGEYINYCKDISIASGMTSDIDFEIYLDTVRTYFLVSVMDKEGNVIKSKNIYSEPVSLYNGLTAVISKDSEDKHLKGIDYVTDNYYYTVNSTVFVESKDIPAKEEMLMSFNCLLFRDNTYQSLADEQKKAIKSWVKNGGCVITDSFENAEAANGFNEFFDVIKSGSGFVYIGRQPLNEENELKAYNTIPVKKNNDSDYSFFSYNIGKTPSLETEVIRNMFLVLIVYIAFIGPVLYFFLKKIDKREKAIIIIPAAALIFVFAINVVGKDSVYKNGIVSIASRLEIDESGNADGISYFTFNTAEKGEIVFESDDIDVNPVDVDAYLNYDKVGSEDIKLGDVYKNDSGTYSVINADKSWSSVDFKSMTEIKLDGGIDADFYLDGKVVKGSVTNNTGLDLEEVVVRVFNTGERIEKLQNGQTEQIAIVLNENGKSDELYYGGNAIGNIYGFNTSRRDIIEKYGKGIDNQEAFKLMNRMRFVENEFDHTKKDSLEVDIIAFSSKDIFDGEFLSNGSKTVNFYETMLVKSENIDFSEVYEIPYGNLYPASIKSSTEDYGSAYGTTYLYSVNDDIVYTYIMPERSSVREFEIDRSETYAAKNGRGTEQIYIFNVSTDEWEELKYEAYTHAERYIDENNTLKLKLKLMKEGEYSDPRIKVKGGSE